MCYEMYAVATGYPVAFIVQGYDPTDFLRGHYIRYDVLNNMTSDIKIGDPENSIYSTEERFYRKDGYISLVDSNYDGFYDSFGDFYWQKPDLPYINAKCNQFVSSNYDDETELFYTFSLDNNQDRYYLDETLANFVEDEINLAGEFLIVGSLKSGLFRASHIEVNGVVY